MDYYRCENPDCGYVAEGMEPDVCPRCGGTFFQTVLEEELTGSDWVQLGNRAVDGERGTDALACYQRAAALGEDYLPALTNLGYCYATGTGVEQDFAKALECFQRGAEKGFPRAQFLLAEALRRGDGVERNDTEAAKWYQSAAWLGYPPAQTELGRCLEFGTGVAQSLPQAVKWYTAAAEQGHAPGQCCLGFLYESGQGVEQSWEEAVRWYQAAAEQDYPRAQCNLAWCYEYGQGVEKDQAEAVRLYRAAAEQGYPRGLVCLGFCYERGRGVPADKAEAARLYRAAEYVRNLLLLVIIRCIFVSGLLVYINGQIDVSFAPVAFSFAYPSVLRNFSATSGAVVRIVRMATFFLPLFFNPSAIFSVQSQSCA